MLRGQVSADTDGILDCVAFDLSDRDIMETGIFDSSPFFIAPGRYVLRLVNAPLAPIQSPKTACSRCTANQD